MSRHACVVIVHYSATGNVYALAERMAVGAQDGGAEVRLRRVPEIAPQAAIESNDRWAEFQAAMNADGPPHASLEDLEWAHGIALGTPTRFGGPAAQLKAFTDTTGGLWARGVFERKVVTAFTSASTTHGGLESTVLATLNLAYHWGSLIMPTGYVDDAFQAHGNPYGASWVSRSGSAPDNVALRAAYSQGHRLAGMAALVQDF